MKRIRLAHEKYNKLKSICVPICQLMAFGIMACTGVIIDGVLTHMPIVSKLPSLIFIIFIFCLAVMPYIIYIQLFDNIFEIDGTQDEKNDDNYAKTNANRTSETD